MKIMSSKRDDILRRKAEYEDNYRQQKEAYDKQKKEYDKDISQVSATLEYELHKQLDYLYPNLRIDVNPGFSFKNAKSIRVRIDNGDNPHDESQALSWSYQVSLEDGKISKETSSWSGLDAVSPDHIEDLRRTLSVLDKLSRFDWDSFLDVSLPDYDEYITNPNPNKYFLDMPDFDQELKEADVENIIGKDIWVHGEMPPEYESRYTYGEKGWFKILRETAKFYRVAFVPDYRLKRSTYRLEDDAPFDPKEVLENYSNNTSNIRKDRFFNMIDFPLDYFEDPDIEESEDISDDNIVTL